jgi:hypothetical protein
MTVRRAPAAQPDAPVPSAQVPPDQVFVRMYRGRLQGETAAGWLGDCFLIRLVGPAGASHILIDCGILPGSARGGERARAVVDDIIAATGGTLDLLVVTHQHADHISGFVQARDAFFGDPAKKLPPRLAIGKVWMAWTENPDDDLAKDLNAGLGQRSEAFEKLTKHLEKSKSFGPNPLHATLGVDAFLAASASLEIDGKPVSGRNVMAALARHAPTEYHKPGKGLPTPGAVSVHAHVLGPPRTRERLFQADRTPGVPNETYFADTAAAQARETYMAATASNEAEILALFGDGAGTIVSPFARSHSSIPADQVAAAVDDASDPLDPGLWLRQRYYDACSPDGNTDQARRRIDDDWLAASGAFALKLDGDTNNTSLVLAFTLPDDSFLLFAADAQVGNWLSWHDQEYRAADETSLTARDILRRTRLYKVGHHGSINATLRELGLELMEHPDLVAMIPTDEAFGHTRPGDWKMPNTLVHTPLIARTKGRILRNDRDYAPPPGTAEDRDFTARLTETDMFIEYRVFG